MAEFSASPYRVLITGAAGFVGHHLVTDLLQYLPSDALIIACSRNGSQVGNGAVDIALDVTDAERAEAVIREFLPTNVIHLASISSLVEASKSPGLAWQSNVMGTLHLCEALATYCPGAQFLNVGSSEIYGGSMGTGPATEATLLAPLNVYACTKAAADILVGQFGQRGLSVVRVRPFNHLGPGQSERFVVASFAAQIARIEKGLQEPIIRVGNLDAERDFLDVRDVVAAYRSIILKGTALAKNVVFNIASGRARRIREALDGLLELAARPIAVQPDPSRMRPSETPLVLGDAGRARALLGWAPRYSWRQTLSDILDDWRYRVSSSEAGKSA